MTVVRGSKAVFGAVLALMLVLSACSSGNDDKGNESSPSATSSASASDEPSASASGSEEAAAADPFGKYDPAIDLTVGRASSSAYKFVDGESFDSNIWTKEYQDKLGVNVKNEFIVDEGQFDAKVNVVIASGEIPDLMLVRAPQMKMLMEADLIYDMTDIFDQYASPMSKDAITSNDTVFKAAKVNGKLYGIPMLYAMDFQINNVWIRSDWLKKLNLPDPKTYDDLVKVAEAFTTQDPDGNGKDDTYGFGFDKGLIGTNLGVFTSWTNMLHAYKEIWLKDASGSLAYSSIQPEMKTALQKLSDLYKKGVIDQEFAVKDGGKIAEDVVAEKTGLVVGAFWNPAWPFQDLKNKNADSDWKAYPILSSDGDPALTQANAKVDQFYVVSKSFEHPEAVVKLLNLSFEDLYGSKMDDWSKLAFNDTYKDIQTFKYPVISMEPPALNRTMLQEVQDAKAANDESLLKLAGSKDDWKKSHDYLSGDVKGFANFKIRYEENGGMQVTKDQLDSGNMKYNEFYGVPGPVYVEKWATMLKLENEVFTKIIMGAAPIDDFDKFVEQWKKIGGDDLTKETNDWYANNK